MDKKKLLKITERITEFPTLPTVIARVMQIMDDPKSSAADLTNIIQLDQAMMFRILKMANSAYYGFPRAIATVTESIVLLGFTTVRNIILTTMIYQFDQLWNRNQEVKAGVLAFDQNEEWHHAVATAIATRELINLQQLGALENSGYLAGLMHDIGKILFFQYMPEDYKLVLQAYRKKKQPLWQLEQEMLGADHGQVGSWIVDKWNLPEDIVVPISNHHQPENSKDHQELTWDLYWANLIAYEALGDRFHEAEPEGWRQQMERMIDLGPDRLDALIVNIRQEVEHIKSYMELA